MMRKLAILIFSLLAIAFLFRTVQSGHHWAAHHLSPEHNYKALTFWSAFYLAVCAGFAFAIAELTSPADGDAGVGGRRAPSANEE